MIHTEMDRDDRSRRDFVANKTLTLPGLVDLQVNGFDGVDFNRLPLAAEDVRRVCRLLGDEGAVAFLPTLITNDLAVLQTLAQTILDAADSLPADFSGARIPGLHLEGPFISPRNGARGAHPEHWVRRPDLDWLRRLHDTTQGRIRIMTLSPEWDGAAPFIEAACAMGIRVAIGHTLADRRQIADAVQAGATLSTHLGNGIPALLPRHPNPIWSQLAEDRLWASLIGDGFHLPREVFDVFRAVKGDKALLVSDSTEFAGLKPGRYESLIGGQVVLTPEGCLHMAEDEVLLAGSAMSLRTMIDTLARRGWMDFESAWQLGSVRPWSYLGETEPLRTVDVVPPI